MKAGRDRGQKVRFACESLIGSTETFRDWCLGTGESRGL